MADAINRLTTALSGMRFSDKKPELPAFDKKNIDLWIKRVEAAFTRAHIETTGDKFAHLESKLSVDEDPRINEFLFGATTPQRWDEFCAYLRQRHGLSRQQRASIILNSFKRERRKPSEMFSVIKERVGDITVDDIIKEMVVRELPPEVQRSIWEKTQTLDGIATAELADTYFNNEGQTIHKAPAASINAIDPTDEPLEHPQSDDEQTDVNALGAKAQRSLFNEAKKRQQQSQSTSQPKPRKGGNRYTPKTVENGICWYHAKFGKEAQRCLQGCQHYDSNKDPKGQGPRRT